ncbi:MAG: type I pantothenate kinase, partial [Cellulomonas sp.]|nr:type I pantothenate kinase [Cellulomonas sp.]
MQPAPAPSPYVDLDRAAWVRLAESTPLPFTEADVERLRGLGDPIDLPEADAVYRPLTRLLDLHVQATRGLHQAATTFLRERPDPTPFVIGVAGSVAVGKSTVARLLRELIARWPTTPRVELVTTDGFLYPNAELERRGLMERKGFPESYDRRSLLRFVQEVKAGNAEVTAPVYSHLTYDIVPDRRIVVHRPDVLIVEGLNVLQPARVTAQGRSSLTVSDFFDFSIYVDARERDVRRWYIDRFLGLRST